MHHPAHAARRATPHAKPLARLLRFAAVALALPIAAVGTGCQASATQAAQVRLHNQASHRVAARIVHIGVTPERTLLRSTLGPEATTTLGPIATPERGSLQLVLEPVNRNDFILRAPVPAGLTAYHVDRPYSFARLELAPAQVNPEWTYAAGFLNEHQWQTIAEADRLLDLKIQTASLEAAEWQSAERRADAEMMSIDQP